MNNSTVRDAREIATPGRMSPCILCEGTDYRVLRLWVSQPLTRCNRCGLVTVETKPSAASIKEFYQGPYGEDWLKRSSDGQRLGLFVQILKRIRKRRTPGHLLDVGCGSGLLLHEAAQRGWKITGVEISPFACRFAKARFGIDLFQGELTDAGLPDGAFDVVTFIDVLNHLGDPLGQLWQAYRVLKPGGLLVVRVPNFRLQSAVRRLSLAFGWLTGRADVSDYAVFHIYNFSPGTLKRMLEKAGFSRMEIRPSCILAADLSRTFGPRWKLLLHGARLLVFAAAHVLFCLSGRRWAWAPSIEAYAERQRLL